MAWDENMIWRAMATLNKKKNKYGCCCAYCGYLFIAEEHEFNTGRWDKKGRWFRGINCPCCTDVIPLEYMEKLQTTADEERFHKMMEEYPDGFTQ